MGGAIPSPEHAGLMILAGILLGWLVSLMFHEWAHSIVAFHGGDAGVADRGYLSWNPLRYLHPLWSLVFPMVILLFGGIALPGAAVYIDRSALRSRAWESAVSLAGPVSNLLLGLALGIAYRVLARGTEAGPPPLGMVVLGSLVYLQLMACVFNLLPLPPLDGWNAIRPWLSPSAQETGDSLSFVGIFVLLSSCSIPPIWAAINGFIRFFGQGVLGLTPMDLCAGLWNLPRLF